MSDQGDVAADVSVAIVGAGPAGLWAAFQLGLHGIAATVIEAAAQSGGQCAALYDDKPVYDVPGFREALAGDIVERLLEQTTPFSQAFLYDCRVAAISRDEARFHLACADGRQLSSDFVILATGLGPFAGDAKAALTLPDGVRNAEGMLSALPSTFETALSGLFAIGDAVSYPGKLPLIISACHEAALAAFAIKKAVSGQNRLAPEFSSTSSRLRKRITGE
jgi:thioredoxin reductase (NADPH)